MFTMKTKFITVFKKDLFLSSLFPKRLAYNILIQPCSTSAVNVPKVDYEKENLNISNLPHLPVQPLKQMLTNYLKSVKPFVTESQFEATKLLVDDFCNNENSGKKLQELLEEKAKKTQNWISDWWLDVAYLECRKPVVVHSSPVIVWPKTYFSNERHQLSYAAHLIAYALNYNSMIERNGIEFEMTKNKEKLCMSQYKKMFGSCRIPKIPKDELMLPDPDNPSNNIIVIFNNHLFSIPAYINESRVPFPVETYFGWLLDIYQNWKETPGLGVGLLTSENRDNWAKSYEKLKQNPTNKEILEEYIEKALFVICIDKAVEHNYLSYDIKCSKLLFHGFGSKMNGGNRWYDKTIQFVVGPYENGRGIIYEHSPVEGGPVGALTDYLVDKVNPKGPSVLRLIKENFFLNSGDIKKLDFVLSDSVLEDITLAANALDKLSYNLDVNSWSFNKFGKNHLKGLQTSTDSFIQIAMQLAFFDLHNHPAAQYESGTLRRYLYGRTDVIRSCSEEVVQFCRIMKESNVDSARKSIALEAALNAHKAYVQNVVNGCGVDRHLLALKLIAETNNMKDLKIFSDIAYQKSSYFQLSTSNIPIQANACTVYGPLVKDGYACCYNPRKQNLNFGMSAWNDCPTTYLEEFRNKLELALCEMIKIINS